MMSRKLLLFILIFHTACFAPRLNRENNVFVIAIPRLKADLIDCSYSSEALTPNINEICTQGVRFTHAYTPSAQSNAALGSILTGLYPAEHGVRNNGPSEYKEGVESVAQLATAAGVSTFFVSGGAPAFKKSGISAGFFDFDDSFKVQYGFFRPAEKVVDDLLESIRQKADENRIFAVLHFSDLLFPEKTATSSPGEIQEGNYNGKIQTIDSAIGRFKSQLQKMKLWDQATVFIVGLNGWDNIIRDEGVGELGLFDELIHIPLIVKLGQKPRDQVPSWKMDIPVTLADLGSAISSQLKIKNPNMSKLPVVNLIEVIDGNSKIDAERPLFSESDLPAWRGWGPRLMVVRQGEWAYFPVPEAQLFNTFTDRYQFHDLLSKDIIHLKQLVSIWEKYKDVLDYSMKSGPSLLKKSWGEKLRAANTIFSRTSTFDDKLQAVEEMILRSPDDWQIIQWKIRILFEHRHWNDLDVFLKSLPSVSGHKSEIENLKRFVYLKKTSEYSSTPGDCFDWIKVISSAYDVKFECSDSETAFWMRAFIAHKLKQNREMWRLSDIAKNVTLRRREQIELSKNFWASGAQWDYDQSLPGGPSIFEMALELQSGLEFENFVMKKLKTESESVF